MKNIARVTLAMLLCLALAIPSYADYVKGATNKSGSTGFKATAAGCLPGSNFKYLEINNVRTRINTGGDMWWDFEVAQYEIPKGSKKTSMFAAALWIGGIDVNDQLKLAALRFRQSPTSGSPGTGNDFWPGPLTIDGTAAISEETCAEFDELFPITRAEIDEYLAWWDDRASNPGYQIPKSILDWPAHGDISKKQSYYLAPFFDRSGDGNYDPEDGDYPYYDISNELCQSTTQTKEGEEGIVKGGLLADQVIKGDATLWWVFNDKGNIHTETRGTPIGLEIRAQAFGFSTNDEINNMTFYSYEIINRSTFRLRDTYFSQWVDTDLGYAGDDYVGCDVGRGLGYSYNGKPKDGDGQFWAYGDQPPAIGVDFFQGPYMDPDGSDNPSFLGEGKLGPSFNGDCSLVGLSGSYLTMEYGDETDPQSGSFLVRAEAINGVNFGNGIVDDERFGMRRFVYHTNGGPAYQDDPRLAPDYYKLLRGIWKDNTKMIYGGNAHASAGGYGPACDFMFPGDTDICDWGTGGLPPAGPKYWTEEVAQNPPADRRFMQSAGPFILEPGAVNYITVGIPWARAASGGPWASVKLLQVVDDKCQLLFDNCFAVVSGPNAPDLTIRELDKEFIFYISNRKTNDAGNNFNEAYRELDPAIKAISNSLGYDLDPYYRFEGYQVFQLKDANVSVADIRDQKLARLVYQSDIKNGITQLVNHNFDQSLNANVPVEEVNGADLGITHTFKLSDDAFSGQKLVNHKQYYYLALAYGYNEYFRYTADPAAQEEGIAGLSGQKRTYLAGRKNIRVYTGIPHIPVGPIQTNADYGSGVEITRLQGQGNGGNAIDLTDATIAEIMSKKPIDSLNTYGSPDYPIAYQATYKAGRGPIDVKVIDPLNVKNTEYILAFDSLAPYYIQTGADSALSERASWTLTDINSNITYRSDTLISFKSEMLFPELGLSVTIGQILDPGPYPVGLNADNPPGTIFDIISENNGLIESTFTFADSSKVWVTSVPDIDGFPELNWIRSGVVNDGQNSDWNMPSRAFDPNSNYEKVIGGTWAPYLMVATTDQNAQFAPAFRNVSKTQTRFSDLASVDVVYTSDKSKWTRCPVVEMCSDPLLSEGNVERFNIRAGQSIDKDGNFAPVGSGPSINPDDANYIAETGMGWFPGYAINIETGERLNMVYGENSWLVGENGRDMKFNPTSNLATSGGDIVLGGMHYLYVFSHTVGKTSETSNLRAYDAGQQLRSYIPNPLALGTIRALVYSSAMWVTIPMAVPGQENNWLSNDAKVRIRIAKPYRRYYSTNDIDSTYLANHTENRNFPKYKFSTESIATTYNNIAKAQTELDLISVVPNPYYAYSSYETNQLDNRVKIVNLPRQCTITIYTTNGTLIRQFTKDESGTSIDWDLKNYAGIPIAGGVYLVHVKAEGIGEKVVKWFGSLRPVDLNSF